MSLRAAGGAEIANALFGRRSTVTLGLALFVALALIRTIVVVGVGDRVSETHPEIALKIGRDSPEALASEALVAWQAKQQKATSRYALAALDRSPLNVLALRMQGLVLDAQGKSAQAETLMRFANTRGWRDDGVQAWLMRDDLVHHNFNDAFLHADALARRRPELWPVMFLLFEVGAGNPDSAKAIAERLGHQPLWRHFFLQNLAASKQRDPAVEQLFQLVDQGPEPLTGDELSFVPKRLAGEGRFREAFATLRGYHNGPALTGSPFDGGFADRTGVAPFAWERLAKPGASLDMDPAPNRPGSNGLRVEYDGYSASDLMRQALAPAAGDYLLTGEVSPESGDAHILSWQVRCATGGQVLASVSPDAGLTPNVWRRFAARFTVPAQGCDGVWLVLAETPQDHRSSNAAWFTNLSIRPLGGTGGIK